MKRDKDCIAILVTTSGEGTSTLDGAKKAKRLSDAKISSQQDILRARRLGNAMTSLANGMKVLFHQGGSPAKYDGKVVGVGRLVAAGYVEYVVDLEDQSPGVPSPSVDQNLLVLTQDTFPGDELTGLVQLRNVRHLIQTPLTKTVIGRRPNLGNNYILVYRDQLGV